MPFELDKEKTGKKIGFLLENIKSEIDPHLLDEYRSLFKQEVSFFRRSWVAAYLLMLYDQSDQGRGKNRSGDSGGRGRGGKRNAETERRPPQREIAVESAGQAEGAESVRRMLPEEESRRLFISIGRNRRVFPREILGLIYAKASVSREDIGAIRILDNYSFIQVRDSVADTIIDALNGKPFRGRVLTVNYARSRQEEEGEDAQDSEETFERDAETRNSEQGDNRPDEESI
jgi:hypothetical protein